MKDGSPPKDGSSPIGICFKLEGMDVYFPYKKMYPEQYKYMLEMKHALDAKGHGLLEMPTGTGKTACVLSLVVSYQLAHPEMGKLIYCTRTVPEMSKCIGELKRVVQNILAHVGQAGAASSLLALCLSSRRNMCIHETVMEAADREAVDSLCRDMTASWVRQKAQASPGSVETCDFYEEYDKAGSDAAIPNGIFSLDDLKVLGREKGWCPYFLARHVINHAKVLVYNYQYMLDPKVAGMVSRELESESVVIFDEAHNIDNVCIEALSVALDRRSITAAHQSLDAISTKVREVKTRDASRLQDEYRRLVAGLNDGAGGQTDTILANPSLPADVLSEAVPGNIRRAEHFVSFLRTILTHLEQRMISTAENDTVETETPLAFVHRLCGDTHHEIKPLKFAYSRLNSLLRTLEVTSLDQYNPLQDVTDLITLVATYSKGFAIVIEPNGSIIPGVYEPTLQLACLDASIAIKPVFERFSSVIITSGTLSPLDLYPRLLNFQPVIRVSLDMSVFRTPICPLVITQGSDQAQISTRFEVRDEPGVVRNYGALLLDLASTIPDGIVVFFTSYMYMEKIVFEWDRLQVFERLLEKKLVFIETKDVVETTMALENYKRACNCGRGAVFLSVARGKVAEGIDFDQHYGRCVMLIGVPYQYTLSHILRARLEYLRTTFQIREADFLTFDALRQAAQCVGRVMRSKKDYGVMVFADSRYNRYDKRSKLPPWIQQFLKASHLSLSTDMALDIIKGFMREMGQPIDADAHDQMLVGPEQLAAMDSAGAVSVGGTLVDRSPSAQQVLKNGGGRGTMAVKALAATVDTGSKNGISSSLDACEDEESIEAEMYGDRQDDNNDDASSSSRGNNNNSEDAAKRPRLEYVT